MQPDDVAPGSPEDWLRYARSDLAIARAYPLRGAPASILPSPRGKARMGVEREDGDKTNSHSASAQKA
jgi:hypothetical protein